MSGKVFEGSPQKIITGCNKIFRYLLTNNFFSCCLKFCHLDLLSQKFPRTNFSDVRSRSQKFVNSRKNFPTEDSGKLSRENFSRKFVKFLSGWKNFQKSCQDRKICRIPKKLLSGEKFDIPGKNCQIPENFGPDRKIARFREKLPDSGKSGKVAVRTGISRFRPETSQELPVSTGN